MRPGVVPERCDGATSGDTGTQLGVDRGAGVVARKIGVSSIRQGVVAAKKLEHPSKYS